MQSQRRQPTRLSCLWDFPGKNTGVGCHFLLQCMKVKRESEVAIHHQFLEFNQTHVHRVGDAIQLLILCRPLLLLPSIFPSIRIFSNESLLRIRWPEYWSFSFNISPSNEYSGRISFRMDWLDLLAVQGTLKSLLQHHSSKASILRRSAFFIVQLSNIPKYTLCLFLLNFTELFSN